MNILLTPNTNHGITVTDRFGFPTDEPSGGATSAWTSWSAVAARIPPRTASAPARSPALAPARAPCPPRPACPTRPRLRWAARIARSSPYHYHRRRVMHWKLCHSARSSMQARWRLCKGTKVHSSLTRGWSRARSHPSRRTRRRRRCWPRSRCSCAGTTRAPTLMRKSTCTTRAMMRTDTDLAHPRDPPTIYLSSSLNTTVDWLRYHSFALLSLPWNE